MKIELIIDGEKKVFTSPFIPMLAKRRYLELTTKYEKIKNPSPQEQLDEHDELYSILTDVVFKDQFTLDDLYGGASHDYIETKMVEAVFGIKPKDEIEDQGNEKGE